MANKLPNGWAESELKEIGKSVTGGTPPKQVAEYYGEDVLWVKPNELSDDIDNPYIYTTNEKLSIEGAKKVREVKKDSVLMCCIGSIGKLGIATEDLRTNQQINSIKFDNSILSDKLGYYSCFYNKQNFIDASSKAVVPILNKSSFDRVKIQYPIDKKEQEYIVETLDTLAEMIRLRKKGIALSKELIPSIFQEMFGDPIKNEKGWELDTLGNPNICTIQYGYTETSSNIGDMRYIRITDINADGYIDNSNIAYVKYNSSMEDYTLKNKDLLVARTGATFAKTLIYMNNENAIFASYLIRIKFNCKKIIPEFYWAYTKTPSYWHQAESLVSGVAQPQFNGNALKEVKIFVPPLPLQQEFANKVAEINEHIEAQQTELALFEDLFQSTLQKAFTGELTSKGA